MITWKLVALIIAIILALPIAFRLLLDSIKFIAIVYFYLKRRRMMREEGIPFDPRFDLRNSLKNGFDIKQKRNRK